MSCPVNVVSPPGHGGEEIDREEPKERPGTELDDARAINPVVDQHPGPINRGIEIGQAVADGPRSTIEEQVTNGVAVRMAVLYLLCGGSE